MIKIGITGSLASGKTTASKILSYRRGPLFSADKAVKEFASSIQAMQRMEFEKTHRPELAKVIGAEISAFFSLILSMIVLISMGVYWILG